MPENQVLALNTQFQTWKSQRATGLNTNINLFEYYCLENYLRDWVQSDQELQSGLIGGGGDGGVDAMYFFVDGELVTDTSPQRNSATETTVLVFQVKEGDGFSPQAITKLKDFADDLLNIGKSESNYHSIYKPELLKLMHLFKTRFQALMGGGMPDLDIQFFYISKKDVATNDECNIREDELKQTVKTLINKSQYSFSFVNATALWNYIDDRPKKKITLTLAQAPLPTPEGYIGLVNLSDYYEFLKDKQKPGQLNKTIFDSNVRSFWPKTPINKDISKTLSTPTTSAEFWLLNNGIAVLASEINTAGYLLLEITDPQIVNGLQTSRLIYDYYHSGQPPTPDTRRILVRVIKLQDEPKRDSVIRCTNNQNKMPVEALRATESIHREIEMFFTGKNLYYDRRKGYYKELRKPIADIVSILDVLQAMLSCLIGRPDHARGRPREYFGDKRQYPYDEIFGQDKYNLTIYYNSIMLLRRVDKFLESQDAIHRRNLRFYMCQYIASTLSRHARVIPDDLLRLDVSALTEKALQATHRKVTRAYNALAEKHQKDGEYDYDGVAKGTELIKKLAASLNRKYPNGPKLIIAERTELEPASV